MARISVSLLLWTILCISCEASQSQYGLDTKALASDTETSANETFNSSIVALVRQAMHAPKAKIQIGTRSEWFIDYFEKGSTRWWQLVFFRFKAYSPMLERTLSGIAVTVFVYDPARSKAEIMSLDEAVLAIKKGRELNLPPEPSQSSAPNDGTI